MSQTLLLGKDVPLRTTNSIILWLGSDPTYQKVLSSRIHYLWVLTIMRLTRKRGSWLPSETSLLALARTPTLGRQSSTRTLELITIPSSQLAKS
ncbi:unnamed protein product [Linum tenue]|uniref:Uncharacterized protein n=1 Tax=Linum tenue TaxID=586396 RepID=A0AAV0I936_9ROSI|nr:unnamed protein product [Linum tenue]